MKVTLDIADCNDSFLYIYFFSIAERDSSISCLCHTLLHFLSCFSFAFLHIFHLLVFPSQDIMSISASGGGERLGAAGGGEFRCSDFYRKEWLV